MPYSNSIGVSPAGLSAIAKYLGDVDHDDHVEYELTPIHVLGATSVRKFIELTVAAFRANLHRAGRVRAGRRPKNAASWVIVRTPDGTWLTEKERNAYEKAVLDEAGHGSSVVGLMNWHRNRSTGSEDLNLLSAAFSPEGELLRDRSTDPIRRLRHRMDSVTQGLNVIRRALDVPVIQTMQEAQKNVRQQRGTFVLEDELAKMSNPPRKVSDIFPAVLSTGCQVTRYNPELDLIAVIKPKKKKAKRYSILELLRGVAERLMRKKSLMEISEPDKKSTPAPFQTSPPSLNHSPENVAEADEDLPPPG